MLAVEIQGSLTDRSACFLCSGGILKAIFQVITKKLVLPVDEDFFGTYFLLDDIGKAHQLSLAAVYSPAVLETCLQFFSKFSNSNFFFHGTPPASGNYIILPVRVPGNVGKNYFLIGE